MAIEKCLDIVSVYGSASVKAPSRTERLALAKLSEVKFSWGRKHRRRRIWSTGFAASLDRSSTDSSKYSAKRLEFTLKHRQISHQGTVLALLPSLVVPTFIRPARQRDTTSRRLRC